MATRTLTLTEDTNCNTNTLAIRSYKNPQQEVKLHVDLAQSTNPSTSQTVEHPGIQNQLSLPETDGDESNTQSFTSNLNNEISTEYNETEEVSDAIGDIDLNGGNTTYPQSAQPDSNPAQLAMFNKGQSVHPPVFLVPKVPVPHTRPAPTRQTLTCSLPLFRHYTVRPEPESCPRIVFQEDCVANVTDTADTGTETHSTNSSSVESAQHTGGMSDFIILHTDADLEAACMYKEHLLRDIGIHDLTVDLISNVNLGRSEINSLSTLHDNYRYILTYVTDNLTSDRYTRFLQEILIKLGLTTRNGKEDRVVPVLTRNEQNTDCKIEELCIFGGLQYHRFQSNGLLKKYYIASVQKLVKDGRKKCV